MKRTDNSKSIIRVSATSVALSKKLLEVFQIDTAYDMVKIIPSTTDPSKELLFSVMPSFTETVNSRGYRKISNMAYGNPNFARSKTVEDGLSVGMYELVEGSAFFEKDVEYHKFKLVTQQ